MYRRLCMSVCNNYKIKGSSGPLMCDGRYSCTYFVDIIYTTDIECNGYQSCDHLGTVQTSNGDLYCNGLGSCRFADISSGDLNKKNPSDRTAIYANAPDSISYGTVSAERIYGYGLSISPSINDFDNTYIGESANF